MDFLGFAPGDQLKLGFKSGIIARRNATAYLMPIGFSSISIKLGAETKGCVFLKRIYLWLSKQMA
ncbi:MAG: hypothetical protein HKO68_19505 [Desulfobacterales bacterium]|nr:hypothetical protein [Desulfobacterales bacterium]